VAGKGQMGNMANPLSSFTRDLRLTIVILFCGALSGINIAKLAPTITTLAAEFDLSLAQIGTLASIFTIIMVVAGSLIGGFVHGVGAKRVLLAALLVACLGNIVSLSGGSVITLFVGRAIEGVSLIALTLTAPTILAQHTALAHRGWVMGIWGGFMPFGCAFAIISAPYLIEQGGWQLVWQAGLVFSVFVCLIGWLLIPNDTWPIRYDFDIASLRRAVCLPLLTFIGLSFACHSLVYQTLIQFTPLITQSFVSTSPGEGALITGLFCLMNFFGNLIAGRALQRGRKPGQIIRFIFSIVPLLLIAVILFHDSSPLLFLLLSLIGLVTGGSAPIFFYLVSRSNQDPKDLPIFVAWTFQIQGLGMLIGPALVGWVVDVTQNWSLGILCLLPACLAVIGMSGRLALADQH
jgi:DHA1 family inner membrane transport protein